MLYTTNEAEMRALCKEMLPFFMEYLRTHQAAIEQVELAVSKEGVTSFPATQELGGVQKTVRVPLSLITRDVDEAEQLAREQAEYAKAQGDYAKGQGDRVSAAVVDIATEKAAAIAASAAANKAASDADASREQIEANETRRQAAEAAREEAWQWLQAHPMERGDNGNWWAWSLATHDKYDTGIAIGDVMYPMFIQNLEDGGLYMYYASEVELARFFQDETDGALYFCPLGNSQLLDNVKP